jgi:hypothetical protein
VEIFPEVANAKQPTPNAQNLSEKRGTYKLGRISPEQAQGPSHDGDFLLISNVFSRFYSVELSLFIEGLQLLNFNDVEFKEIYHLDMDSVHLQSNFLHHSFAIHDDIRQRL